MLSHSYSLSYAHQIPPVHLKRKGKGLLNFVLWLQMIFCPYVALDLWHCTMSLHVLGRNEAKRKGLKRSQHSSFLSCVSFCQLQNIFPEKSASHQVHLSTGCVCKKLNQIFSRSPPPILECGPISRQHMQKPPAPLLPPSEG